MTDPVPNLANASEFERRLLDAAKHEQIPAELKLHMSTALHAPAASGAAVSGGSARWMLSSKPAAWTLLSVIVLGAGLGWQRLAAHKPAAQARVVMPSAAPVAQVASAGNAVHVVVAADSGEQPSSVPARAANLPRLRSGSSLRDEIASLDRVSAALKQQSANQALALLQQHTRRFARGQLVPEAEALHIEALLLHGEPARADAQAERFLRTYPEHPLTQRVRALLASRSAAVAP